MARTVDGTATILEATKAIARVVGKFGTTGLQDHLGADFVACVNGLVSCWRALQALDNMPYVIDTHNPAGPEDEIPS